MYTSRGNKHTVRIGGKTIEVDSNLEERVITELENHGFHGKWRRTKRGITVKGKNYTPDLEISLGIGPLSYRALVEIKPSVAFFWDDKTLVSRFIGIASHYDTEYFLVYTDDDRTWWRLNPQTRQLEAFGFPTPGKLAMWRLYQPLQQRGRNVYAHQYVKKVNLIAVAGRALIRIILVFLETFIAAFLQPKKPSRRSRRRS